MNKDPPIWQVQPFAPNRIAGNSLSRADCSPINHGINTHLMGCVKLRDCRGLTDSVN